MSQRNRFRSEPSCSQCGNEEDLDTWPTGEVICRHCLRCPHVGDNVTAEFTNGVCTLCLRLLHTLWTFRGPVIRDLDEYVACAAKEYVIRSFELLYWTFDEQEAAVKGAENEPLMRHHGRVTQLPPHLRRYGIEPP